MACSCNAAFGKRHSNIRVRLAHDKSCTQERTLSELGQEEGQEERQRDDRDHYPAEISLEFRDANLHDGEACWGQPNVHAHGSKLGFVECAGRRVHKTRTAGQASNTLEPIGTDELIVGWRELAKWEFVLAWDGAVFGRGPLGEQKRHTRGRSHAFVCAGSLRWPVKLLVVDVQGVARNPAGPIVTTAGEVRHTARWGVFGIAFLNVRRE